MHAHNVRWHVERPRLSSSNRENQVALHISTPFLLGSWILWRTNLWSGSLVNQPYSSGLHSTRACIIWKYTATYFTRLLIRPRVRRPKCDSQRRTHECMLCMPFNLCHPLIMLVYPMFHMGWLVGLCESLTLGWPTHGNGQRRHVHAFHLYLSLMYTLSLYSVQCPKQMLSRLCW